MHYLDFLDICAILLGIFFTIAKLDAQSRQASAFQQVPAEDFERWRDWTVSIYRLGSSVCFLRVIFHQGWALYLSRQAHTGPAAPRSLMYPALAMDLLFLSVLAATFMRGNRARALRRQLGIVLTPLSAPAAGGARGRGRRRENAGQKRVAGRYAVASAGGPWQNAWRWRKQCSRSPGLAGPRCP